MPRGRPGGNPDIKEYGFKTDREHPLSKKITLRVDEPTREAIRAGKLPNWSEIARSAIEQALKEVHEQEQQLEQAEQDLKSA